MDTLRYFDPYADIRQTKNRLPHWQQRGALYFVTFRLADSIPRHLLDHWRAQRDAWLKFHPPPWSHEDELEYHRLFSGSVERWLDANHGSCLLRQKENAQIVGETLRIFDGVRHAQIASVIMPNHVHTVFLQHPTGRSRR